MHEWVDPHNGNDALALQTNVTALNPFRCLVTEIAPADVLNTAGNPLLHQPYPFKTITAAVAYINSLPFTVSPTQRLPYLSPITGIQWDFAIIHLLPGRYASINAPQPQSAENQLVANGETFPIELPNRVSIQGTSALDTVIELSRFEGPAFLIGNSPGSTGDGTFISTISIMGGNADVVNLGPPDPLPPGVLRPYTAAAISIARSFESTLRIDDCFFFGNGVGVLVDAVNDEGPAHEVTIANCTFAWNSVGIWSGDVLDFQPIPTVGRSSFLLVNNIFDTSPPPLAELTTPTCGAGTRPFPARWLDVSNDMSGNGIYGPGAMTAFEGLDFADLRVSTSAGFKNFNAYEQGIVPRFNRRIAFPSLALPATSPRALTPAGPDPGFDIAPLTGAATPTTNKRGVLFVTDLFRNGYQLGTGTPPARFATTVSCDFDLSPMDFRLAPATAPGQPSGQDPVAPGSGGALNQLVDRGYGDFPIVGQSGVTLSSHPRTLSVGNGTWTFSSWGDYDDAEGYGNRRVFDHPVYANFGPSTVPIDVGADEVDLELTAGFRYGTRTFTQFVGQTTPPNPLPVQVDNRYIWVLGPPDTLSGIAPNSGYLCGSVNWWASPGPANYNNLGWIAWSPLPPATYYNPLVTDITPHLLPDLHPYHAITTAPQWPSNPVWQDCPQLPAFQAIHNPFLYIDPTANLPNPAGVYPAFPVSGFVFLDGVTSPWSGHSLAGAGLPGYWLFGFVRAGGSWDLGGAPTLANFGNWCQSYAVNTGWPGTAYREAHILGDAVGTPAYNTWNNVYPHIDPKDTAPPGISGYQFQTGGAERLSLELFNNPPSGTAFGYMGPSNLQTFMIWRQTP